MHYVKKLKMIAFSHFRIKHHSAKSDTAWHI